VPASVITKMEKCAARVMMRWETFLMNHLLTDYKEEQEKGMEFHYAWLLILIAFTTWRETKEMQFLEGM
jgi:hypothetical protein